MGKGFHQALELGGRPFVPSLRPENFQPKYVRPGGGSGSGFDRQDIDSRNSERKNRLEKFCSPYRSERQSGSLERQDMEGIQREGGQAGGGAIGEAGK